MPRPGPDWPRSPFGTSRSSAFRAVESFPHRTAGPPVSPVAKWIRHTTDEVLQIEDSALYPALHRMEHRGWISADWGLTENNRRAKYYTLTTKGRQQLRARVVATVRRNDLVTDFCQDVRVALRSLSRAPGFVTVVSLTPALGIGLNSGRR